MCTVVILQDRLSVVTHTNLPLEVGRCTSSTKKETNRDRVLVCNGVHRYERLQQHARVYGGQ